MGGRALGGARPFACTFPHATALCAGGACKIGSCNGDYVDVDGKESTGCECHKLGTTDTTCDGVDDDCNGMVDDGYVPAACGQGACTSKSQCVLGSVVACSPGLPASEGPAGDPTCMDQVDNDCDGLTDDGDPDCVAGDGGTPFGGDAQNGAPDVAADADPWVDAAMSSEAATTSDGSPGTGDALPMGAGGTSSIAGAGGSGGTSSDGSFETSSGGSAGSPSSGSAGANAGGSNGMAAGSGGLTSTGSSGASSSASGGSMSGGSAGSKSGTSGTTSAVAGASNGDTTAGDEGGCACRVGERPRSSRSPVGVLLFGMAVALARRRRRGSIL